ncbi:conjugal transfer protein TraA [Vibrio parahaemolyticus]|uniref:conjugal transfer protein TraA n=1 Tax=Vibrio parahaemolyticus TaxID=670 RepID=UPI002269EC63|nr:conjugal transfer protein TraA [Vibrio parahaemolyticus]MCX8764264.1 conjugal transfer protein TraA [Vibrio parahaemolyticus]
MLQKAYELLDRRLDEKIREKNLKIPTIAAAKESINIVCQEKISIIEKMMT